MLGLYILAVIAYIVIGDYVSEQMWKEGFSGSRAVVKLFGGIMWPITFFMVMLVRESDVKGIK